MKTLPLVALASVSAMAVLAAMPAVAKNDDCHVPMANWQTRAALRAMAEAKGWHILRIKIEDGCYEVYGRDPSGRKIEAEIDPGSLAVVKIEAVERGGIDAEDAAGDTAPLSPTDKTEEVEQ